MASAGSEVPCDDRCKVQHQADEQSVPKWKNCLTNVESNVLQTPDKLRI